MLDFYLIRDDQAKPEYPEVAGLEQVGELDEITFEMLKRKKIIAEHLDYYTDFRWDTSLIKQIREGIQKEEFKADSCVKKLARLLDFAEQHKAGLVAYCD